MLNQLPTWEILAKVIIWKQIGTLKGKTILDFGSGIGITADHFSADNNVIAVESSEEMLTNQVNTNGYQQIIGSTDKLKELPSKSFDCIFCHNVLEYVDDREEIVREFYRLLKPNGKLSIVKHNRNGRVMQMVVLLNNFEETNSLLDGHNSTAQQFGTINYYDNGDITKWCDGFALQESYGLRTFWDLQQNQEIQKNEDWQEKMIDIEMKVSQKPDFQKIAFFHHIKNKKRGN